MPCRRRCRPGEPLTAASLKEAPCRAGRPRPTAAGVGAGARTGARPGARRVSAPPPRHSGVLSMTQPATISAAYTLRPERARRDPRPSRRSPSAGYGMGAARGGEKPDPPTGRGGRQPTTRGDPMVDRPGGRHDRQPADRRDAHPQHVQGRATRRRTLRVRKRHRASLDGLRQHLRDSDPRARSRAWLNCVRVVPLSQRATCSRPSGARPSACEEYHGNEQIDTEGPLQFDPRQPVFPLPRVSWSAYQSIHNAN